MFIIEYIFSLHYLIAMAGFSSLFAFYLSRKQKAIESAIIQRLELKDSRSLWAQYDQDIFAGLLICFLGAWTVRDSWSVSRQLFNEFESLSFISTAEYGLWTDFLAGVFLAVFFIGREAISGDIKVTK